VRGKNLLLSTMYVHYRFDLCDVKAPFKSHQWIKYAKYMFSERRNEWKGLMLSGESECQRGKLLLSMYTHIAFKLEEHSGCVRHFYFMPQQQASRIGVSIRLNFESSQSVYGLVGWFVVDGGRGIIISKQQQQLLKS
jgi:hypothetical protein